MTTTTYDVLLRYRMQDMAGKGVVNLGKRAEQASKSVGGLNMGIGRMVATAAGLFSIKAATDAFMNYNDSIDQARITMAGLMMGYQGGTFNDRMKSATSIVDELQQKAKTSTSTTEELVNFLSDTVGPLSAAGLRAKDMATFTAQAVTAAKAFRSEGVAALDIQQALTSQVTTRDKFAKQLLEMNGVDLEHFNNKLTKAQRLVVLQKALANPAIAAMAKAQESSFSGMWSTFKDNMQIGLGAVGKPLFAAITAELAKWNGWIEANSGKISQWAITFGEDLKKAFEYAKGAIGFLVEHKDLLMALAKAWLISKAASAIGGGMLGAMDIFKTLKSGSMSAATKLDMFALAVTASVAALEFTISKLENRQERNLTKNADIRSTVGLIQRAGKGDMGAARALLHDKSGSLKSSGLLNSKGNIDSMRLNEFFSYSELKKMGGGTAGPAAAANELEKSLGRAFYYNRVAELLNADRQRKLNAEALGKSLAFHTWQAIANSNVDTFNNALRRTGVLKDQQNSDVKVTINRIEAKSEDPDRFVFALEAALEDVGRNPRASMDILGRTL